MQPSTLNLTHDHPRLHTVLARKHRAGGQHARTRQLEMGAAVGSKRCKENDPRALEASHRECGPPSPTLPSSPEYTPANAGAHPGWWYESSKLMQKNTANSLARNGQHRSKQPSSCSRNRQKASLPHTLHISATRQSDATPSWDVGANAYDEVGAMWS